MKKTFTLYSEDLGGIASPMHRHLSVGGSDCSPQLSWENAPDGTRSLAVTIHDADAPTGSGFWHWVLVDLPPDVSALPSGAGDPYAGGLPGKALQARNDAGVCGYTGPFPPPGHGWHLYLVTVYALDVDSLCVESGTPAAQIGFRLWEHTIEKASLVFYDRVPAV